MYQQMYQQNDVPIGLTVDTQAKHRLRSATPGWNLKKDLRTSPASIFPETWQGTTGDKRRTRTSQAIPRVILKQTQKELPYHYLKTICVETGTEILQSCLGGGIACDIQ